MNLYKKLFNIVRNNPNTWEENKIELLWNILLSSDKRSFTEYFKEEHNIDLSFKDEKISSQFFLSFIILNIIS